MSRHGTPSCQSRIGKRKVTLVRLLNGLSLDGRLFEVVAEIPLSPHEHMALDEVLLERFITKLRGPTLRFWGWTAPALILGSNQSVANEVVETAAREHGFTLTRRISGGGTMLAEPGRTITWSLILPDALVAGMSFADSYQYLDRFAVDALRSIGVAASYRPLNDIVAPDGGKIAGAAQARRRDAVLHHVTLAWDMDVSLLRELIRAGRPAVSGRGVRSADRAVSPLRTLMPKSVSREDVVLALSEAFGARPGALDPLELDDAATLAAAKYSRPEWIYRLP
jgi:lipoate-protein ligase A